MTEADWLEEAGRARDAQPVLRPARVRRVAGEDPFWSGLVAWRRRAQGIDLEGRQDVALYAEGARRGDLPLAIVSVPSEVDLGAVAAAGAVAVRGVPGPGHAVVLEVDRRLVPTGPGSLPAFLRRRWALR